MSMFKQVVLAGSTVLGLWTPIEAADPAPPATAPAEDPKLNRAAYSALHADDDLSDLNIGVRVLVDGTAILWGTATPTEVQKAEAVLRSVPGVLNVRSTCDSVGAPDPLVARVEAGVRSPAASDAATPSLPATPAPTPKSERTRIDPPPLVLPPGAAVSRNSNTVEKHKAAKAPRSEPVARLLQPAAVSSAVDYAAVDRVRRGDTRFARLTFDLRDGRVVVGGSSSDPAAAWELARAIAPFVGDRDVVVGRVTTDRR